MALKVNNFFIDPYDVTINFKVKTEKVISF